MSETILIQAFLIFTIIFEAFLGYCIIFGSKKERVYKMKMFWWFIIGLTAGIPIGLWTVTYAIIFIV